ncbi:MAG: TetR/AcrR family transcriptional regulator [Bacteroidales bacterium]|nr:TetR/AcrR family transcriptional regulator [Bacteroidales bacterium]MCB9000123.1 TetR/AcrR family transcriptional regulator [Bacteroidales bacterium]MCB9014123.1 TetR/AcrR family transcriptional regulator [Bacteroidales bacterium]
MAPRTKDQNKEIRETRRKMIMQAALELFSKEGYHSTSINGIAKRAEISKGLLYNYFESKEELLKIIIMEGIMEMENMMVIPPSESVSKSDLIYMIDSVFERLSSQKEFWMLFSSVLVQPDVLEIVSGELGVVLEGLLKEMEDYLRRSGSPSPREDAYVLGALFDGISLNYFINPEGYPLESVKNRVKEIFVR